MTAFCPVHHLGFLAILQLSTLKERKASESTCHCCLSQCRVWCSLVKTRAMHIVASLEADKSMAFQCFGSLLRLPSIRLEQCWEMMIGIYGKGHPKGRVSSSIKEFNNDEAQPTISSAHNLFPPPPTFISPFLFSCFKFYWSIFSSSS